MTEFNHGAFVTALRARQGSIPTKLYADLMASIDAGLGRAQPMAAPVMAGEPAWMVEARRYMGVTEIPGAKHNPIILSWWKALGRPYTDDETPHCGGFQGYCMKQVGLPVPSIPERAKAWADWGKPCAPVLGAVAVFGRDGGGHVGMLAGQSAANWYVLGSNQRNQVNIMPIAKDRLIATRWPASLPLGTQPLPQMSGGIVSRNEA
ncbi:TIGR02594 family protein [Sphingomonas sp.]|uniref:TIGR02594 family protein n=1 Tax=Sphingomonas sp. TaxID=28214 RepID=UPI00307D2339